MSKTFAILYGLMEGEWHGKKLTSELQKLGLQPTKNLNQADVLIAHSAGWLFLPKLRKDQQVIIINPSYSSDMSYLGHFMRRVIYDVRHVLFSKGWAWLLAARTWNIIYLVTKFLLWIELLKPFLKRDIKPIITQKNVLSVQTADKAWYNAKVMAHASKLVFLPGDHDACWRDSANYSKLIVKK